MSSIKKKRKVIHSEGRKFVSSVIEKCDDESRNNCLKYPLNQATRRAAHYANVSETTIKKQTSKGRKVTEIKNCPPRERSVGPGLNTQLYSWTILIDVLLEELSMIFIYMKKISDTAKLLPVIKNRIHFPWGKTSLYKIMRKMGFKWKKCRSQ
jgi:hypothetical protein